MSDIPLRCWNSASYSATNGRAAKSTEGPATRSFSADQDSWTTSDQITEATGHAAGNTPSWTAINKSRSNR
jgi:hypothetical protein